METPEKPGLGWDAKINRICSWVPNGSFQGFGVNLNDDNIIDHIFTSAHFKVLK